jgi:hypothetical protein
MDSLLVPLAAITVSVAALVLLNRAELRAVFRRQRDTQRQRDHRDP